MNFDHSFVPLSLRICASKERFFTDALRPNESPLKLPVPVTDVSPSLTVTEPPSLSPLTVTGPALIVASPLNPNVSVPGPA